MDEERVGTVTVIIGEPGQKQVTIVELSNRCSSKGNFKPLKIINPVGNPACDAMAQGIWLISRERIMVPTGRSSNLILKDLIPVANFKEFY
ncbi:MAG TPA: hypothetical protein VGI82_02475 [Chitinophagaceae bacterium]|jgi:hypothetical protein